MCMAHDPTQRASDAEREEVADRLRAAAAEGRLDPDELDERVGHAYAARTHGELAKVTEDLPAPAAVPAPAEPAWKNEHVRHRLAGFIVANVVCNGVWLATGAHTHDWWPKWVLLGTGIALVAALVHAVFGIEEEKERDRLPRPPAPPGLPRL